MNNTRTLRVLVACEFSGTVRDAFTARGHDAMSCDLLPTEKPGPHYQGDVREILYGQHWDLMIAHPDCKYLTSSAEWAYKDPDMVRYPGVGYHQKLKPATLFGEKRRKARQEAIDFFLTLWCAPIENIVIENPVGVVSKSIKPTQIIQPNDFGHDASKATCLWIKGLPGLRPTDKIHPRIVNGRPRWSNQSDNGQNKLPPSDDRWKLRAKTYQGIAEAFAHQWG